MQTFKNAGIYLICCIIPIVVGCENNPIKGFMDSNSNATENTHTSSVADNNAPPINTKLVSFIKGCANKKMANAKEILINVKDMLDTSVEQISCNQLIVQNSKGSEGIVFAFKAKSRVIAIQKVTESGLDKSEEEVDFINEGGKTYLAIAAAYLLIKKNELSQPGMDIKEAEFNAILATFPISAPKSVSKIPVDMLSIQNTRGYKTIAGRTVYWGEETGKNSITVIVETSANQYVMTSVAR